MDININQDTSRVEVLGDSGAGILQKLYDLDKTNDIQTLSGNIKINVGYEDIVEYLTTKYPNLSIDVVAYAFKFEDPEIQRLMETKVFKTTGITTAMVSGLTALPYNTFNDNKTIIKFNEFERFTGITTLPGQTFYGCQKLEEITFPPTLTEIPNMDFTQCYKLKQIILPDRVTKIGYQAFMGCSGIQGYIILPHTVTELGGRTFEMNSWDGSTQSTRGVFILSSNFPTINTDLYSFGGNVSYSIYVKYAHYNQYASLNGFIDSSTAILKPFKLFRYTSSSWTEITNPTQVQVREALNNINEDWAQQIIPLDGDFPSNPEEGQLSLMEYSSVS